MSCYREYCPRCKRVQLVCEGVCQCGALLDLVILDDGFPLTSNQKESSNESFCGVCDR